MAKSTSLGTFIQSQNLYFVQDIYNFYYQKLRLQQMTIDKMTINKYKKKTNFYATSFSA